MKDPKFKAFPVGKEVEALLFPELSKAGMSFSNDRYLVEAYMLCVQFTTLFGEMNAYLCGASASWWGTLLVGDSDTTSKIRQEGYDLIEDLLWVRIRYDDIPLRIAVLRKRLSLCDKSFKDSGYITVDSCGPVLIGN